MRTFDPSSFVTLVVFVLLVLVVLAVLAFATEKFFLASLVAFVVEPLV